MHFKTDELGQRENQQCIWGKDEVPSYLLCQKLFQGFDKVRPGTFPTAIAFPEVNKNNYHKLIAQTLKFSLNLKS